MQWPAHGGTDTHSTANLPEEGSLSFIEFFSPYLVTCVCRVICRRVSGPRACVFDLLESRLWGIYHVQFTQFDVT
jgi:hypothetical protein